jgi:hypothetical protein
MKRHSLKRNLLHFLVPVFSILLGSIALNSCYYDNEEYLYPPSGIPSTCDTLSPTYAANIAPIFASGINGCNGCHGTKSHPGTDVITDNYKDLTANIGRVWNSINHIGGHDMPKGGGKLTDCELAKIRRWRNLGMFDN